MFDSELYVAETKIKMSDNSKNFNVLTDVERKTERKNKIKKNKSKRK